MHFKCLFTSSANPQQAFEVIEMHGREQLDDVFVFRLTLRTAEKGFDPEKFLGAQASLTFGYDGQDSHQTSKYGLINTISSRYQRSGQVYLDCVLVPRISLLASSHNFRTFIDTAPDKALEKIFQDCTYPKDAYEFRLATNAQNYPYFSQYDESDLHFFKRRLEQQGWTFFIEFADNSDKVVVTDKPGSRKDWTEGAKPELHFVPPGHDSNSNGRQAQRFARKLQAVPHKVRVKDWSYEHPDLNLESEAEVQGTGFGETYLFGDGPWAMESIDGRARRLAEKWGAASDHYLGVSDFPLLLPGQECSLKQHPESGFNTDYLPVYVEHMARLAVKGVEHPHAPGYSNRFLAIRADRTYRPLHTTPEPVVTGGLHGFVESENADYAQLDAQGRYKVRMGFDAEQRNPCKSSSPLRLLSPHAGQNYGMHFPLRQGTEVLLGHENGNPDRPLILGVLPNAKALGPVTAKNASVAGLHTPGDNELFFEDNASAPYLQAHSNGVTLRIGSLVDAPSEDNTSEDTSSGQNKGKHGISIPQKPIADAASDFFDGICWDVPTGKISLNASGKQSIYLGTYATLTAGLKSSNALLLKQEVSLGDQLEFYLGGQADVKILESLWKKTAKTAGLLLKSTHKTLKISSKAVESAKIYINSFSEEQQLIRNSMQELSGEIEKKANECKSVLEDHKVLCKKLEILSKNTEKNLGTVIVVDKDDKTVAADGSSVTNNLICVADKISNEYSESNNGASSVSIGACNKNKTDNDEETIVSGLTFN